jgi:alkyl hydroperoxide reductase subunit F
MQATPNITSFTQGAMKSVDGEDAVSGVTFQHDDQTKSLAVDGVFVEIGYTVNPGLMKDIVALDGRNQIIVDPATNGTDVPGLFAAGDVTTIAQKQVVISAGEGAKAALAVDQYLQRLGRKPRSGITDWGVSAPLHHQAT